MDDQQLMKIMNNIMKNNIMDENHLMEIINDIFLTNYWCTRKNMVNANNYIVGLNEIIQWYNYFKDVEFPNINRIGDYYSPYFHNMTNLSISSFLEKTCEPIFNILNIGNGKMSLCGGSIISLLKGSYPNDFDLFFHSDSVDEIDDIFNNCLNYINVLGIDEHEKITYTKSQYIMQINFSYKGYYYCIQFIKRVYKTKEQILFGFDLAPSRLGYNPKDGIFATICGAISFSMKVFCIDSSKRSTSFGHRLSKYCYDKEYTLLLPQLNLELIKSKKELNNLNDEIMKFEIFDKIYIEIDRSRINKFFINDIDGKNKDYMSTNSNLEYLIYKDYEKLEFSSTNLQEILELSDNFIEKEMIKNTREFDLSNFNCNFTKSEIKNFLQDNNKYKEFIIAYFIDDDIQHSQLIWDEQIKLYINQTKEAIKNLINYQNYYKGWKYLNPGSKYFGQNYPCNDPVTEYYNPLVIGINNQRFQALMDCRKNIEYITNLPKELFNLICEYWLKYEVEDAKNRLFMLKLEPIKYDESSNYELKLPSW